MLQLSKNRREIRRWQAREWDGEEDAVKILLSQLPKNCQENTSRLVKQQRHITGKPTDALHLASLLYPLDHPINVYLETRAETQNIILTFKMQNKKREHLRKMNYAIGPLS